jgi:hypothetical protein
MPEQVTDVQPSVSIAGSFVTITFCCATRLTPSESVIVTMAGETDRDRPEWERDCDLEEPDGVDHQNAPQDHLPELVKGDLQRRLLLLCLRHRLVDLSDLRGRTDRREDAVEAAARPRAA